MTIRAFDPRDTSSWRRNRRGSRSVTRCLNSIDRPSTPFEMACRRHNRPGTSWAIAGELHETMNRSLRVLLMMAALLATVATADAQQSADPRVADLVRAGKLRVALFLPQYTKDPATGELAGNVVYMEGARALAGRPGVEVELVGDPTPPTVGECL